MSTSEESSPSYRFISKANNVYKVSVPKPQGGYRYKSIGFKKIGEEKALKIAVAERNKIGKEEWGKFWSKVLSDNTLLARLPRSLEPVLRRANDKKSQHLEYVSNWMEVDSNGSYIKKGRRYSCEKHGKLGAYIKAKNCLLDAHKSNMELLSFMGRNPIVNLI